MTPELVLGSYAAMVFLLAVRWCVKHGKYRR
jgi:hypothetical protein